MKVNLNDAVAFKFRVGDDEVEGTGPLQGPAGPQGPAWVVGATRSYQIGLECVPGNLILRTYPAFFMTVLFRCLQPLVIDETNFPSLPMATANWEIVMIVSDGRNGTDGADAEYPIFDTAAEADAWSAANPGKVAFARNAP